MRFILDENLPPALARALHALSSRDGHRVEHVRDRFGAGASDLDWISAAGRDGRAIIVSGDRRMLTREHELRALRDHRLTTFILASGWVRLGFWDKAWLLTRWWPRIIETTSIASPGSIFRVPSRHTPSPLPPYRK